MLSEFSIPLSSICCLVLPRQSLDKAIVVVFPSSLPKRLFCSIAAKKGVASLAISSAVIGFAIFFIDPSKFFKIAPSNWTFLP